MKQPFLSTACDHEKLLSGHNLIELACDSLRKQGRALNTCTGLAGGHPASECNNHIAKSLLKDVSNTWSTIVMRTTPFPADLFRTFVQVMKSFYLANLIIQDVINGVQRRQRWQLNFENSNQMSLLSAILMQSTITTTRSSYSCRVQRGCRGPT